MKYPNAGDLQRETATELTANPPWEVRSDSGVEGSFADREDADLRAGELRRSGVKSVRVLSSGPANVPRRPGAPPLYHRPHGRPPGVPNPPRDTREPWTEGTTIVIEHNTHGYTGWLESAEGGRRLPISFARRPDTAREAVELAKKFLRGVHARRNPIESNPPRFRQGERVRFAPSPSSLALYGTAPPVGTSGTVTTVSLGGRRASYIPGPGGGLVYVDWSGFGVQGVSPNDLERPGARGGRLGPARGNPIMSRWRVWAAHAPDSYVQVTAEGYRDAMQKAAVSFQGEQHGEPIEMIAKIDGGRAIEELVSISRGGRIVFHPAPSRGVSEFIVVGRSTRTGAVMYLCDDGGPSKHRTEAGRFSVAEANRQIADATTALPKWTFTMENA